MEFVFAEITAEREATVKKIFCILASLAVISCADMTYQQKKEMTENAIELLRIGMTIAQATGIIGMPVKIYELRSVGTVRYEYPDCVLIFRKSKLSEIKERIK